MPEQLANLGNVNLSVQARLCEAVAHIEEAHELDVVFGSVVIPYPLLVSRVAVPDAPAPTPALTRPTASLRSPAPLPVSQLDPVPPLAHLRSMLRLLQAS